MTSLYSNDEKLEMIKRKRHDALFRIKNEKISYKEDRYLRGFCVGLNRACGATSSTIDVTISSKSKVWTNKHIDNYVLSSSYALSNSIRAKDADEGDLEVGLGLIAGLYYVRHWVNVQRR